MSSIDERQARLDWRDLRRFGYYYLWVIIAVAQIVFLFMLMGVDFPPYPMLALIPGILPLTIAGWLTFWDYKKGRIAEPHRSGFWMLVGILLFAFWSGGYFLAGALTSAERARFLAPGLESRIPFWTDFSLIYVLVFPLFLLPFFSLRSERALQRAALSNLLTIFLCTITFLIFPVTFARPALPAPPDELGAWILSLVHGADPAWNCLPSEHCAMALVASLALFYERRWLGVWAFATAMAIAFSTLCLKQHYLIDAVAGFAVALGTTLVVRWPLWPRLWARGQRWWRRSAPELNQEKKFMNGRSGLGAPDERWQDSSEI